jgi:hypothetical protein
MTERGARSMVRIALCATAIMVLFAWLAAAGAAERLSADKISAEITRRYGVTVLRVTPIETDGRAAYLVTVMNPGGDDNGAFRVSMLLVDAASGGLISQFVHLSNGYELPASADRSPSGDDAGLAIRRMTEREYRTR